MINITWVKRTNLSFPSSPLSTISRMSSSLSLSFSRLSLFFFAVTVLVSLGDNRGRINHVSAFTFHDTASTVFRATTTTTTKVRHGYGGNWKFLDIHNKPSFFSKLRATQLHVASVGEQPSAGGGIDAAAAAAAAATIMGGDSVPVVPFGEIFDESSSTPYASTTTTATAGGDFDFSGISNMVNSIATTTTTTDSLLDGIDDGGIIVPGLEPQERRLSLPAIPEFLQDPVLQGRALVIVAAAIYGTNFATVKMMNDVMPTAAAAAVRFTLAAVAVCGALAYKESMSQSTPEKIAIQDPVEQAKRGPATWLGIEVGAWYCIGYLFQAWGLHTADASKSAFFNSLAVLVVPILDTLIKKKGMGLSGIASMVMALAGVGLIQIGPSLLSEGPTSFSFIQSSGDWFCLAQALFFGIGYWRLESASTKYSNQADVITAGQLIAVALGSVAFFLAHDGVPSWDVLTSWLTNPFVLKAAAWTGLVSTALALYMETVALKTVSASELTVLMTSVSVFGSAFAYVTMGEVVPPIGMVGGALIMGGCALTAVGNGGAKEETKSIENELR